METKSNPYSYTDANGVLIDWSGFVGEVCPSVSLHDKPITKEELAVICGRRSRECALVRAVVAMRRAGESDKAILLVQLNLSV